jgi:signal peptidase I
MKLSCYTRLVLSTRQCSLYFIRDIIKIMFKWVKNKYDRWKAYKQRTKQHRPGIIACIDFFETLLGAFIIAMILRQFIVQSSLVFSGSMIPTLNIDDRLIVNKLVYHFNTPDRGDIVLFNSPYDDGKQYVKRLIGLPGDTIEITRGLVYINNKILVIPGVTIRRDYASLPKQTIPTDHYFMLGDNRANSADSRVWGYVPKHQLIGEALFTYWPINRIRWVR